MALTQEQEDKILSIMSELQKGGYTKERIEDAEKRIAALRPDYSDPFMLSLASGLSRQLEIIEYLRNL